MDGIETPREGSNLVAGGEDPLMARRGEQAEQEVHATVMYK